MTVTLRMILPESVNMTKRQSLKNQMTRKECFQEISSNEKVTEMPLTLTFSITLHFLLLVTQPERPDAIETD